MFFFEFFKQKRTQKCVLIILSYFSFYLVSRLFPAGSTRIMVAFFLRFPNGTGSLSGSRTACKTPLVKVRNALLFLFHPFFVFCYRVITFFYFLLKPFLFFFHHFTLVFNFVYNFVCDSFVFPDHLICPLFTLII